MKRSTLANPRNAREFIHRWLLLLLAMMCFITASPSMAKRANGGLAGGIVPTPVLAPASGIPPQFDLTGFIEEATLDTNFTICPNLPVKDPRLAGGTVKINGQTIIVPCNTILQMPAFALSWADLWTMAPKDTTPVGSGLSLTDAVIPGTLGLLSTPWTDPATGLATSYSAALPTHELHVQGNVINGEYIAGLVFISQQSLNSGQGIISCIDYATGEMQVGGTPLPVGATPCPTPAQLAASGQLVTRVRMNDPIGRYGIVHGGPGSVGADVIEPGYDPRYTADTDNPTMHSAMGFPICIPSINPVNPIFDPKTGAVIAAGTDPLCPMYNRPIAPNCKNFDPLTTLPAFGAQASGYCTTWVMDPPGAHTPLKLDATDPTVSAPLVPGDTITFSGTMKADANGPYISAHTIAANLGIYTQPHTQPSYVTVEVVGVGTGGANIGGLAVETTGRLFWVGFASDPTELVDMFAVHQDPVTGASTEFYLGTQNPCCTPLGRFRTPVNNLGAFGDPTRNYRAVSRTACQPAGVNGPQTPQLQAVCHLDPLAAPDATAKQGALTPTTNGLMPNQFTLPNFNFIFPENLNFGTPLAPMNMQDLPFLFCGSGPIGGPGSGTTAVGQLDPAPWALPMPDPVYHAALCPTAQSVGGGTIVALPPAPKPAVINSVTATPAITSVNTPTTVTLTAVATDPNTPANLAYSWTFPAGVTMSCGSCVVPNAGWGTVTATFNPAVAGTLTFGVTVFNGVLPSPIGSVGVVVAPNTAKPPILKSFNANPTSVNGGTNFTLTAIGNTNPVGGPVKFTFKQTGGPAVFVNGAPVALGQPIPITSTSGVAPADQTANAIVTAPYSSAKANLTFQALVTDSTFGLTTTGSATQVSVSLAPTLADTVAITAVAYRTIANVGGQNIDKGKLTVTATSSLSTAVANPVGLTMTATYVNNTLPANVPGSTALPLSLPLILQAADVPGTVTPVCGPTPCWTGQVLSVINDTSQSPAVLVAPTSVTVKSSLGGTATMTPANPLFVIR
jgi:hypothetical protein